MYFLEEFLINKFYREQARSTNRFVQLIEFNPRLPSAESAASGLLPVTNLRFEQYQLRGLRPVVANYGRLLGL